MRKETGMTHGLLRLFALVVMLGLVAVGAASA